MQGDEKLLDAFGVLADLQSRIVEKQTAANDGMTGLRQDMQEIRTDILQMRSAMQQIHQDFVKLALAISTVTKPPVK
jgi:hypothetical protein